MGITEVKRQNLIFSATNRPKINLSVKWLREMGITMEDKEVVVSFDGEKITIEKLKK